MMHLGFVQHPHALQLKHEPDRGQSASAQKARMPATDPCLPRRDRRAL